MTLLSYLSLGLLGLLVANPFLGVKADNCAREWLNIQGNCYAYFETKKTWQEAEVECQGYGRGAHLASILSWSETLLVSQHLLEYQRVISDVWIGFHDVTKKGRWRWADGAVSNYRLWMKNQPDNASKSEYCVELRRSTDFIEWNDVDCKKKNAFICKHEL
ncbi:C-type lectin LmsL-like [Eublepharis macularius]|uniref:C-type lectin LmsL-like n=1 Tax=Eublepharis macularius TaxID=481883 RepID=A0AA97LCX8_EUBMA|nr:C-type lectin LmsL-like [Eublepharis macularius]